jgi:SAM-dependent methyltransferase
MAGVPEGLSAEDRAVVAAQARTFFRQAADLMEKPERAPGWRFDDPTILESQGRASAVIARIVAGLPSESPIPSALRKPGARFLDVGTGVGHLAIAMARAFPGLSVVGIDREPTVLERARHNVEGAGLTDRISLRNEDVTSLTDDSEYDLVWLPAPFLPESELAVAAGRAHRALRPGGLVLLGAYGGEDPLAVALADLRAVRGGGTPWSTKRMTDMLAYAGIIGAAEIPKAWPTPIRFMTGQKPNGA